jgi:hypothetical protein
MGPPRERDGMLACAASPEPAGWLQWGRRANATEWRELTGTKYTKNAQLQWGRRANATESVDIRSAEEPPTRRSIEDPPANSTAAESGARPGTPKEEPQRATHCEPARLVWTYRVVPLAPEWPAPLDSRYVWRLLIDRTRVIPVVNPINRLREGIPGLERLLEQRQQTSPDRPAMLLMLARSYISLSEATFESAVTHADENRCALLSESAAAHGKAIELLEQVLDAHPAAKQANQARFRLATLLAPLLIYMAGSDATSETQALIISVPG